MKIPSRLTALAATAALTVCLAACSSDDEDSSDEQDTVDTTTAPEVQWSDYSGIQIPAGDAGPGEDDPVRHGYEHSPQGAVIAAINTQAQMALADEDSYPAVSRYSLAPGKGRDQWVQGRSLATIEGEVDADLAPAFKGFRLDSYSDDAALVVLATDYPEAGLMAYPVQLTWLNDDWRVIPAPQDSGVVPESIESTDGFTDFSAADD